jgi:hypothetical protein
MRTLVFAAACTLTHNGTNLILPAAANITTAAGDVAVFRSEGAGNWRCISYTQAGGTVFDIVFSLDTGANSTYVITQKASFPFTITNAITKTSSGTITADIKIESTSITSLDALAITSSEADTAATGANAVAVGNTVSVTFSSNSTALGIIVQLRCVRL